MPTDQNEKKTPKNSGNEYHKPGSVEEITQRNVQSIIDLEEAAKSHRDSTDRIADAIARFCGSMPFVWLHFFWFVAWIVVNVMPGIPHFDPYPFTFLTLVVSLEAIFLSTFILISQNYDARLSEKRNHLDLQINLLTEQENTKMLTILKRIADKVGAKTDDDPSLHVLEQATRPEKLVEQIEAANKQKSDEK